MAVAPLLVPQEHAERSWKYFTIKALLRSEAVSVHLDVGGL